MVAEEMKNRGVHFIHQAKPKKIDKQANGRLLVHWVDNVCLDNYITVYKDIKSLINQFINICFFQNGKVHRDDYDTVLFAIGRQALTKELKLENAGVKVLSENGKIDAENEQTNVPNIYAVGDVLHVRY